MKARSQVTALLLLSLGGCVTYEVSDYDQWRDFHGTVKAMTVAERGERFGELSALYERIPSTLTRLQLAYLMTLDTTAAYSDTNLDVATLLDGVTDSHELVPIRDQIRQYLELRESYEQERTALVEARRQCETLNTRLGGLRDERDALQRDIATCKDQLEALKEIESMMSASDDSLEVLP
ncbi:MAG: hypothetical protein AAFY29_16655 [Pseudomonadota bacterium]